MTVKFLTPVQLWQDFDPKGAPLDIAIAYNTETEALRTKGVFFTAVREEAEQIRAFAEIKTLVPQPKKALLTILTEPDQAALADSYDELLQRGFAIMTVDVSGVPDEKGNATNYTEAYKYASFAEGRPDRFLATPSAKSSPVYLWAKIIRRAITLLEYFYPKAKVAVMGAKTAADVAWQVAAMDARTSALIALLGDYSEPPVTEEDSSNADSYTMAISAKSAARMVKCPCLVATCANATGGDVEKVSEIVNQISEGVPFALTVTPRLNAQIAASDLISTYKWLDKTLKGEPSFELKLTPDPLENGVHFVLRAPAGKVQSATLHVSYNDAPAEYRHWHDYPMSKHQDGSFTAEIPVWEGDRELLSYATTAVSGGLSLSTRGVGTLVSSERVYPTSHFLLDTASDHGMYSDDSEETFLSHPEDFSVAECPNGVPGFRGKGALRTNILSEEGRYDPATSLHISVYSAREDEVRVCIAKIEDGEIVTYTALCDVEGEEWTRLSLGTDDFKTKELIPMKDWDGMLGLILPDTDDKLYNNFLWM